MRFHVLLQRSEEMDAIVRSEKRPSEESIKTFLSLATCSVPEATNFKEVKSILMLRRKWKMLLYYYYKVAYDEKPTLPPSRKDSSGRHIANAILHRAPPLTKSVDFDELLDLSRTVNPYSMLDKAIAKIDRRYHQSRSCEIAIRTASHYLSQSSFSEAMQGFENVATTISGSSSISARDLYFLSASLHGIGNVYYVQCSYPLAQLFYYRSLKIKESLRNVPKVLLYSTRIKLLALGRHMNTPNDWHREVSKVFSIFLKDYDEMLEENRPWAMNLREDFLQTLGYAHVYVSDSKCALHCAHEAIEIAKGVKDHIGLIRSYYLCGLAQRRVAQVVRIMNDKLSECSSEERNNPYLRQLLSPSWIGEAEIINPPFATAITSLFRRRKILKIECL